MGVGGFEGFRVTLFPPNPVNSRRVVFCVSPWDELFDFLRIGGSGFVVVPALLGWPAGCWYFPSLFELDKCVSDPWIPD